MSSNFSSIDDLIEEFRALVLDQNINQTNKTNMNPQNAGQNQQNQAAQQQNINYTLLKMYVDTIPHYTGDPNSLSSFLSAGDFLFTTYTQQNDNILNNYLIRTIRMKLIDRAQILVGSRMELTTWEQIKAALSDCFGDKRNLECLEQDLFMATPLKNEHPLDFAKRLQVLRSSLAQKINSFNDAQLDAATKLIYLRQYEQVCLRTFIRGLPGSLQSIIRLKNPNCIEEAMTLIVEEENFQYSQNLYKAPVQLKTLPKPENLTRFNNVPQNNFNITRYPNFKPQVYTPNFNQQYNQNFARNNLPNFNRFLNRDINQYPNNINFTRNFSQNPPFPRGPINVQPRPVQNNYPTNRQVFGPPKNVFKPTGQVPTNKPEPMSTTSRNTMPRQNQITNPIRNNNYFNSNGQRNFIAQELYQIDESSDDSPNQISDNTNNSDNQTQFENFDSYENYFPVSENQVWSENQLTFENQLINESDETYFDPYDNPQNNHYENSQNFQIPGQSNTGK